MSIDVNHVVLDDAWLIDSAATHHVCKNKDWFQNFRQISAEPIGTAETMIKKDEATLLAEGIGDIILDTRENGTVFEITLKDVYYVPRCRRNLLSVAQIEKKEKKIVFEEGIARIMNKKTSKLIATARRLDNLYVLQGNVRDHMPDEKQLHPMILNEPGMWHHRFCHINNRSISELAKKGYVRGLTDSMTVSDQCYGCCLGKSTKAPCKELSGKSSSATLDLLHSDVCGPMPVASEGGSRYFMTVVDDYSRKIDVFFLKSKDEVVKNIKQHLEKIENQKGQKVKRFRSDNGLEYCNKALQELFANRGIKHERTCVETPQMNGVAERANRTLLDMTRSMLLSAKLPQVFWAETVATAAYVRNRMVHSNLEDGVPEGIWTERQASVKHLKVFGCLAYAHLPSQGRRKLDPRARTCIFVGYSNRTRGYRLWDPTIRDIIYTKHVRFDESKVGFEYLNGNTASCEFQFQNIKGRNSTEEPINLDEQSGESSDERSEASDEEIESNKPASKEESNEEDEAAKAKIVGVTGSARKVGRPKKQIRNPYGRRGKPKEAVELNLTQVEEPTNLNEALSSPQADRWESAIHEEIESLERLETWEEAEVPPGKTCIGSRWVFKVKANEN